MAGELHRKYSTHNILILTQGCRLLCLVHQCTYLGNELCLFRIPGVLFADRYLVRGKPNCVRFCWRTFVVNR